MQGDTHLTEKPLSREELLRGGFMRVVRDTVQLPDGKQATREFVLHPGAVMAVPMLEDGRLVLERQYRHPVGRVMIEFPAGKLEAGEDPLLCARRELLEETGYTAREWARAGEIRLAIAYSDEVLHVWFARGLALDKPQLDEGEFVEVITPTTEEFLGWCRDGLVTDSKTLAAAFWLQNALAGTWIPAWRT